MNCDCDATREEAAAGIHQRDCTSHDGHPDDPSTEYALYRAPKETMPMSKPAEYSITASRVSGGRTTDLLGIRTARSGEVDDVCQELRKELRPEHGDELQITVKPR